jgi:hypothetical protein
VAPSALQLHLKDPESYLSLPHTMPLGSPKHHLPIPSLLHRYISTIRDDRRGLFDALIHFLRFLRFLRNGLGVKTSDGSRWLDQVNAAPARSKSSSRFPSLCSTQPHIKGLLSQVLITVGRATYVPGDPVSHHHRLRTECTYSRTTRSCARSVIRARRIQCGVPQLALRAYPDDALADRGGALTRFVERGYPHKSYHHHRHLYIWIWEW